MKKRTRPVTEFRVRVVPQFPPEEAERQLNAAAESGFHLVQSWPCMDGVRQTPVPGTSLLVEVPSPALYCVFVRITAPSRRMPGDEWMDGRGDDDD